MARCWPAEAASRPHAQAIPAAALEPRTAAEPSGLGHPRRTHGPQRRTARRGRRGVDGRGFADASRSDRNPPSRLPYSATATRRTSSVEHGGGPLALRALPSGALVRLLPLL